MSLSAPRLGTLAALLLALAACPPAAFSVHHADLATLRTVTEGPVVGGAGQYGSHAWLGLPFAAPPVGALRWRAPEGPAPHRGTREALRFGAPCPQVASALSGKGGQGEVVGSEDCLTLSVWAPPFGRAEVPQAAKRLPVMVWIHGGGNSLGTASFYDGGRLATEQQAVVVAVQYRLGPLGWLSHPALREGADPLSASGNFGTLDLVQALRWVQANAAAFGGDPGNVTVFGESAGGFNVYTLLLSPQARGLFHRAIVESGYLWHPTLQQAEAFAGGEAGGHPNSSNEVLARLLVQTGRADSPAAARALLGSEAPGALAAWMRGLTPSQLIKGYEKGRVLGMLDAPLGFGDGVVLPEGDWLESLGRPGGWNEVPVVLGTNKDEMKLFLFLNPAYVTRVLGIFPKLNDEARFLAAASFSTRYWKLGSVDLPAEAMRRSGATRVHAYRWDWHDEPRAGGADLSVMLGAAHGLEVPFVFGHFQMGPLSIIFSDENRAGREALSAAMRGYWGAFARDGRPGTGGVAGSPEWSPWAQGGLTHLVLDTPAAGGVRLEALTDSPERILADLLADARLDARGRCAVLHDAVAWGRSVTLRRADYDAQPTCSGLPYDAYPW
jgi:para-nitrobenzyl esterase